jgi:hypothetical protein
MYIRVRRDSAELVGLVVVRPRGVSPQRSAPRSGIVGIAHSNNQGLCTTVPGVHKPWLLRVSASATLTAATRLDAVGPAQAGPPLAVPRSIGVADEGTLTRAPEVFKCYGQSS